MRRVSNLIRISQSRNSGLSYAIYRSRDPPSSNGVIFVLQGRKGAGHSNHLSIEIRFIGVSMVYDRQQCWVANDQKIRTISNNRACKMRRQLFRNIQSTADDSD